MIFVESKILSHHAEIYNVVSLKRHYGYRLTLLQQFSMVKLRWTTHKPRGLSSKDMIMAGKCDDWTDKLGVVAACDAPHCS
jgi:hypothetical protein